MKVMTMHKKALIYDLQVASLPDLRGDETWQNASWYKFFETIAIRLTDRCRKLVCVLDEKYSRIIFLLF